MISEDYIEKSRDLAKKVRERRVCEMRSLVDRTPENQLRWLHEQLLLRYTESTSEMRQHYLKYGIELVENRRRILEEKQQSTFSGPIANV